MCAEVKSVGKGIDINAVQTVFDTGGAFAKEENVVYLKSIEEIRSVLAGQFRQRYPESPQNANTISHQPFQKLLYHFLVHRRVPLVYHISAIQVCQLPLPYCSPMSASSHSREARLPKFTYSPPPVMGITVSTFDNSLRERRRDGGDASDYTIISCNLDAGLPIYIIFSGRKLHTSLVLSLPPPSLRNFNHPPTTAAFRKVRW